MLSAAPRKQMPATVDSVRSVAGKDKTQGALRTLRALSVETWEARRPLGTLVPTTAILSVGRMASGSMWG